MNFHPEDIPDMEPLRFNLSPNQAALQNIVTPLRNSKGVDFGSFTQREEY
jgi:hypothetical protein